jgi:hypothetical protein
MVWHVEVIGDSFDIDELTSKFPDEQHSIVTRDGRHYLRANSFEAFSTAREVREDAQELVSALNIALSAGDAQELVSALNIALESGAVRRLLSRAYRLGDARPLYPRAFRGRSLLLASPASAAHHH